MKVDREEYIGHKVIKLSHQIDRKISKSVAQYGVTGIQAKIIGFVYGESAKREIFQKDIEEKFDVRGSSVTSVLNLMENNGYIKRVSVEEDARLKKIVLQEKGLEIQSVVMQSIISVEDRLSSAVSEEELKTLLELVDKLSEKLAE